ncbi:MAG: ATP-binding protein [Anaerovibrio sp.]
MPKRNYRPRVIDRLLNDHLQAFGAICIEGPKWCGKTWTAENACKSKFMLGDPANNFQNRTLASLEPSIVLQGKAPRLIDEWQEVTNIWDAVRYEVDARQKQGQFILTGSSTPMRKGIMHSGAGRIAPLRMRTMSLWESGDSDGKVSLQSLFMGESRTQLTGEVPLRRLAQLIVRGGWPQGITVPDEKAYLLPQGYINAIIDDGANRLDEIKRDSSKMIRLLKSLARNESTTVSNKSLKKDIKDADGIDISDQTIADYLDVFRRLYVIEDQPPFSPSVRSSVRVKQTSKRHLTDPSISCSLLGLNVDGLINDLETMGFLFEALCERDLWIYAQAIGGKLFHYQDYKGKEIDAIVELPNGEWGAFEIKLGANQIDAAAKNLCSISKSIAKEGKGKEPKFLCVLCGMTNAAYQREDNVYVVPLTSLKP